ncbi:MAG: hypothetical protein K8S87_01715 [Planctomycetes bacterium]|nr:hypothetical protein [Planctomycetota bacterium]
MNQETVIAELIAAFVALSGLLGFLFKWLVNSMSQKLDQTISSIDKLSDKMEQFALQQQKLQHEILLLERSREQELQK